MAAQVKMLDTDGIADLTSYNFGNVVAGASSVPKLAIS